MSMMTIGRVPTVNLKKTGENIARIRKAAGVSVRELQDVMGFTNPQAIYSWQKGSYLPTIDNLVILAAVLDVTIDEIVATDDPEGEDIAYINTDRLPKSFQTIGNVI